MPHCHGNSIGKNSTQKPISSWHKWNTALKSGKQNTQKQCSISRPTDMAHMLLQSTVMAMFKLLCYPFAVKTHLCWEQRRKKTTLLTPNCTAHSGHYNLGNMLPSCKSLTPGCNWTFYLHYFQDHLHWYQPARSLRSTGEARQKGSSVKEARLIGTTVRVFLVVAHLLWNALLIEACTAPSLMCFRKEGEKGAFSAGF